MEEDKKERGDDVFQKATLTKEGTILIRVLKTQKIKYKVATTTKTTTKQRWDDGYK